MPLITKDAALERGFTPDPQAAWVLRQDGAGWVCRSERYGFVELVVVVDESGKPLYERPQYDTGSSVNVIVYGYDESRSLHVGLVLESRAHAQHPDRQGDQLFWSIPRGFIDHGETQVEAAHREARQEMGAAVVLSTYDAGFINPEPSFVRSHYHLVFLQVDLSQIVELELEPGEKIHRTQFFPFGQLRNVMRKGEYEGGHFEDGVALASLLRFFLWIDE